MADNINPEGIKNMLNNDWADMSLKDLKDMQSMVQQSKNLKRKNNLRHDIKELSKQTEETLNTMDNVLSAAIEERTKELAWQNKGFKNKFKKLGTGAKDGFKSLGSTLLKKLPFALLGAAVSLFAATLKNATLVVQKFSRAMNSVASLGKNIKNLDILMGGTVKELTEASAGRDMLSTLLGGVGNQIKNFFGKLANAIVSDDVKEALAKTIRESFILANQTTLIGQGHKSEQAEALARLATDAAEMYLRQTTGASLEDIRNADNYQETVSEMLKLITSGGQYGMFSTSSWKGWAFEKGYLVPDMNYTQQQENTMRAEYLGELLHIFNEGGAAALARLENHYQKVDKRLSLIGQSLYSFDEVEQVAAYTEADTLEELNNFSEGTSSQFENVEADLQYLAALYGLTPQQLNNIKSFMSATGLAVDDIKYLLDEGLTFEDPQAVAYLADIVNNGLTTKGVVDIQGLRDINLNIAEDAKKVLENLDSYVLRDNLDSYVLRDNLNSLSATETPLIEPGTVPDPYKEIRENNEVINEFEGVVNDALARASKITNLGSSEHSSGGRSFSGSSRHYATGGIGTDRIDNATLFENGPEAIIPLTSNLGVDYMARVMEQVNASNGSSDSLTVNFNGPVFTEDQRQLQYWAEKLGETYDTIKKRRGVV